MGRVLQIVGLGLALLGLFGVVSNFVRPSYGSGGNVAIQLIFMIVPGLGLAGLGSMLRKRAGGA